MSKIKIRESVARGSFSCKGEASTGSIDIEGRSFGGNENATLITLSDGQFKFTQFIRLSDDTVQLMIRGDWEIREFILALKEFEQRFLTANEEYTNDKLYSENNY
jgi:hypothetical protein